MRKSYAPRVRIIQETPMQNIMRRAKLVHAADAVLASDKVGPDIKNAAREYLEHEDPNVVASARDALRSTEADNGQAEA